MPSTSTVRGNVKAGEIFQEDLSKGEVMMKIDLFVGLPTSISTGSLPLTFVEIMTMGETLEKTTLEQEKSWNKPEGHFYLSC